MKTLSKQIPLSNVGNYFLQMTELCPPVYDTELYYSVKSKHFTLEYNKTQFFSLTIYFSYSFYLSLIVTRDPKTTRPNIVNS